MSAFVNNFSFYTVKIMFKRLKDQEILRNNRNGKVLASGSLNKLRLLDSIPLKNLNDSHSNHSSLCNSSLQSSLNNQNNSINSSQFSMRSSFAKAASPVKQPSSSRIINLDKHKLISEFQNPSHEKYSPTKAAFNKEDIIKQLLQKHFTRSFIKSLVQFLNKDWSNQQNQYLIQKKLGNFVQSVIQRSNWLKDMIGQFLAKDYFFFDQNQKRTLIGILFRQSTRAITDMQDILPQIIRKLPEQKLLKQQIILEELSTKLLQIYNPKFSYSNAKMKQRMALYLQDYLGRKNDLKADICQKVKPNMIFLEEVEHYFSAYQKQIVRLKAQLSAVEAEKNKFHEMLSRKNNFTPLQINFDQLSELKQKASQQLRHDLQVNIIQFHEQKHKKNQRNLARAEQEVLKHRQQIQSLRQEVLQLRQKITDWHRNVPKKVDTSTQVFLINQSKSGEGSVANSSTPLGRFLQNVVTPFSFSLQVTGSLLSILTIDRILFDYELIRNRLGLRSFQNFLLEWFIIRTGCKKIAQIFVQNLFFSLKQLKGVHKRFWIFYRICGVGGIRGRNMQEDLEGIFFTTQLSWYYVIKLALLYRKKLNQNPTGYHLLPPLDCQQIFKLPLRKIYELVGQFLSGQEMDAPSDLSQKIDHYCINEISKFKANDQHFQKQTLQQIHILRDINFDLVAGFVIEYVASIKCGTVQKLLRTIHNKQKQQGILGYSEFQVIYKRFYKQKRSKIQQIYAKLCLANQHDMLDVQNMQHVIYLILEDQSPLRNSFDKLESLKSLVLSQKATIMRNDKKVQNPNSYQNFRERYYHQFYDFYDTTAFLQEIYKIVKLLIRKQLKTNFKEGELSALIQRKSQEQQKNDGNNKKEDDEEQEQQAGSEIQGKGKEVKQVLLVRLQQWGKIMQRIPHFASKVLTIDQIIIHNMRRREMIQATEYAWRTLRQILTILGKN